MTPEAAFHQALVRQITEQTVAANRARVMRELDHLNATDDPAYTPMLMRVLRASIERHHLEAPVEALQRP